MAGLGKNFSGVAASAVFGADKIRWYDVHCQQQVCCDLPSVCYADFQGTGGKRETSRGPHYGYYYVCT